MQFTNSACYVVLCFTFYLMHQTIYVIYAYFHSAQSKMIKKKERIVVHL